ncbi:prepilin peptidase [Pelosinus fermentans]|uniref:Peptidase A24A prepilin type IV n=1 Tax=Pelosinus fermentans JBW45 TaxID=1192197 RepID=I9DC89_9FIRM|nr:prepilin peptidase [Pelosinus fermentans]AJQ26826.1 peptidase A24A prepilin type IV [Pelosinus fermentans JBW45]
MPEQIAFLCMLLLFVIFTLIVSQVLSKIMQYYLCQSISILEKPEKLPGSHTKRKISLFGLLFFFYSLSYYLMVDGLQLAILWIFITFMVLISIMDFEQQVILDKILFPLLVLALCFSSFLPALLLNRLFAAVIGGGILLFLAIVTKGGIGGGDIKLLFVLGLWLGTDKLLFTLFLGFLSGGLVSAVLLLGKIKKTKDTISYGPYFALSAIATLLC